ncbi:TRAP transporter small permease, partial [Klebsiella aerogenes]|uniref:TRAP transporter small permease n=1 Tax=Klebsiella aerogenes TaxID=548 RepID=UPI0013D6ECC1
NVVLRYGFNSGITVSEEASRMIFVWLTFGGAFLVAREGGHLGMNSVVAMFGTRGRWWCRLAAEILSLFC